MNELAPLNPEEQLLRRKIEQVSLKDLRASRTQEVIEHLLGYVYRTSNKGESRDKTRPSIVGLSANQVGVNLSIAIVDLGIGHKSYNDLHVLVNPVITWKSKTTIEKDEGCVNLDNIRGFVKRSARVKVDAFDRSGNKISLDLTGWPAILLQHETDHLNGKLFIDRLEDPKHAHLVKYGEFQKYKKLKKEWPNFIDVSKLVK